MKHLMANSCFFILILGDLEDANIQNARNEMFGLTDLLKTTSYSFTSMKLQQFTATLNK